MLKNFSITYPLFLEAIQALDAGDTATLERLLCNHPRLVKEPLSTPAAQGYFKDPFLLWFVADNPIRNDQLPENIVEITKLILMHARVQAPGSFQQQLDYTLVLVATGRMSKECGVQNELIDLLVSEGARPEGALGAIAHGNPEAALHLISKGAPTNLATAICLNLEEEVIRHSQQPTADDLQVALVAAAFCGNTQGIAHLLELGADPNVYLESAKSQGFHSHGTALHQAVSSGSLESVMVLVEAGARLDLQDRVFQGTPLGWADHMKSEAANEGDEDRYQQIAAFLRQY